MNAPVDYKAYGPLYAGWARTLSLLAALGLSGLLLAVPHVVASETMNIDHGLLSLCLWGISAGFVHGVGYVPEMKIWRLVFSPYIGWPLMLVCGWWWIV